MQTVWLFQDNARERRFATALALAVAVQDQGHAVVCADTGSGLCRLVTPRSGPPGYCRWVDYSAAHERDVLAKMPVAYNPITFLDAAVFGVARPGEPRAHPAVDPPDVADGLEIAEGDRALLCERPDRDPAQVAADADALRRTGARVIVAADGSSTPAFRCDHRLPDGYENAVVLRRLAPSETDGHPEAARQFRNLANAII